MSPVRVDRGQRPVIRRGMGSTATIRVGKAGLPGPRGPEGPTGPQGPPGPGGWVIAPDDPQVLVVTPGDNEAIDPTDPDVLVVTV